MLSLSYVPPASFCGTKSVFQVDCCLMTIEYALAVASLMNIEHSVHYLAILGVCLLSWSKGLCVLFGVHFLCHTLPRSKIVNDPWLLQVTERS